MGGGVGTGVKLYVRSRLEFFLFLNSTRPQLTPRSVDFRSMHPKCVSVVGVLLGVGFLGVKFPLLPPKPFFNGANKAIILHGSE